MNGNEYESRPWAGYLVSGTLLIIVGEIIVAAARSHGSQGLTSGERTAEFFGGLFVTVGAVVVLVGVIALGVTVALVGLGFTAPSIVEDLGEILRPSQKDPAALADDPDPFAPHEGDSAVVADVRRACGFGSRPIAVRRIISQAAKAGQLSDEDRAMAEAILAEAERRPLGPLRPR